MIQENDKLQIPDKYRKMSVSELKEEKNRVLAKINSAPRNIKTKKQTSTKVTFNI